MAQGFSQLPLLDAQTKSQSLFYQDLAQFLEGVLQEPQACFQPEALSSGDLASWTCGYLSINFHGENKHYTTLYTTIDINIPQNITTYHAIVCKYGIFQRNPHCSARSFAFLAVSSPSPRFFPSDQEATSTVGNVLLSLGHLFATFNYRFDWEKSYENMGKWWKDMKIISNPLECSNPSASCGKTVGQTKASSLCLWCKFQAQGRDFVLALQAVSTYLGRHDKKWRFPKMGVPIGTPNHPKLHHFSLENPWNLCWSFWGSRILRNPQMRTKQAERELEDLEGLSAAVQSFVPNAIQMPPTYRTCLEVLDNLFQAVGVEDVCAHRDRQLLLQPGSCTSPSPPCAKKCWAIPCYTHLGLLEVFLQANTAWALVSRWVASRCRKSSFEKPQAASNAWKQLRVGVWDQGNMEKSTQGRPNSKVIQQTKSWGRSGYGTLSLPAQKSRSTDRWADSAACAALTIRPMQDKDKETYKNQILVSEYLHKLIFNINIIANYSHYMPLYAITAITFSYSTK